MNLYVMFMWVGGSDKVKLSSCMTLTHRELVNLVLYLNIEDVVKLSNRRQNILAFSSRPQRLPHTV